MKLWMGLMLLALLAPGPVRAEETDRHFTIAGDRLLLVNLVGEMRIDAATGQDFEIDVAIRGSDGGPDVVHFDQADGSDARLCIQYPLDKERNFVYPASGMGSSSFDPPRGTAWGESADHPRSGLHLGGRQVKVHGHGKGLEVWADVTVRVPAGKKLQVRHGVGRIASRGVHGELALDGCAGPVEVVSSQGNVAVDTGSGEVTIRESRGDLAIDTGSGAVTLDHCQGGTIGVDTGSGSVEAEAIEADDLKVDTGSGSVAVVLNRMGKGSFYIDTGSGSIRLRLPADASADIRADTGSGDISLDLDGAKIRHREDDEVSLRLGAGEAQVTLDAGSGSIRISQE